MALLQHTYGAIRNLENELRSLRRAGMGAGNPVYDSLFRARADIYKAVGLKLPKSVQAIASLVGLSPGIIRVWFDAEEGWFSEARMTPNHTPVYRQISRDTALRLINRDFDHQLEYELMTPIEPYAA